MTRSSKNHRSIISPSNIENARCSVVIELFASFSSIPQPATLVCFFYVLRGMVCPADMLDCTGLITPTCIHLCFYLEHTPLPTRTDDGTSAEKEKSAIRTCYPSIHLSYQFIIEFWHTCGVKRKKTSLVVAVSIRRVAICTRMEYVNTHYHNTPYR